MKINGCEPFKPKRMAIGREANVNSLSPLNYTGSDCCFFCEDSPLSDCGAAFGPKGLGNLAQALAWVALQ
jgi:hypothetical protein